MGRIWLIGMMGSGKSTIGARVAAARGAPHRDTDRLIEERAGRSIPEIFRAQGEGAFREMEREVIARLAAEEETAVISTGGGAVLDPANRAAMRSSGAVAWLDVPPSVLAGRAVGGRPLLEGREKEERLGELLAERRPLYAAAAHYVVEPRGPAEETAARVGECARLTAGENSEVLIGPSLPDPLLPPAEGRRAAAVLTQPGARAAADEAEEALRGQGVNVIASLTLPDRDAAKTVRTAESAYERLAEANLGRDDVIVGVGGGAVTDVAGFVAATWLRGVECVLVPTTLLAAVDAAIGGKTGVNVAGKNLVGAFRHPSRVAVNLRVLEKLPEELLREGAAEAVKAGFIADPRLVDLYDRHGLRAPLGEVVRRAAAVKTEVVAGDFREAGRRAILNFGHTIGHGVEAACGMPHGLAVAVGMAAAAEVSARRHGFDPMLVRGPLQKLGLPTQSPPVDRERVLTLISRDKKRTAQGLRMVLLRGIGDPVVEPVSAGEIDLGLAAVGIGRPSARAAP